MLPRLLNVHAAAYYIRHQMPRLRVLICPSNFRSRDKKWKTVDVRNYWMSYYEQYGEHDTEVWLCRRFFLQRLIIDLLSTTTIFERNVQDYISTRLNTEKAEYHKEKYLLYWYPVEVKLTKH